MLAETAMPRTPGPWVAVPEQDGQPWIVRAGNFTLVVQFATDSIGAVQQGCAETEANARLMATSPALLDALHDLIVKLICHNQPVSNDPVVKAAIDRAIVTMARAEGRRLDGVPTARLDACVPIGEF